MFIGPCIIVIAEEWKTNLTSLAILFHLCAQHVSDINISILRSLRLCCWITTSVVLFSVHCVLEFWCGWFWVLPVLQAEAQLVVLQPATASIIRSLRLFCWITTPVILFSVRCVLEIWCGWVWVVPMLQAEATCNTGTTQTQPHQISNTQRTENKTTDVVIQQHSRKLLMMDILTVWRTANLQMLHFIYLLNKCRYWIF